MARLLIGMAFGIILGIGAMMFWEREDDLARQIDDPNAPAPRTGKPPAYLIVLGEVYDRAAFGQGYAAPLAPIYETFGGSYIASGGGVEVLEGDYSPKSFVIAKWPDKETALQFWNSPEYDRLRRARIDNQWGDFDVLLVEGLPEPVQAAPLARGSGAK